MVCVFVRVCVCQHCTDIFRKAVSLQILPLFFSYTEANRNPVQDVQDGGPASFFLDIEQPQGESEK